MQNNPSANGPEFSESFYAFYVQFTSERWCNKVTARPIYSDGRTWTIVLLCFYHYQLPRYMVFSLNWYGEETMVCETNGNRKRAQGSINFEKNGI